MVWLSSADPWVKEIPDRLPQTKRVRLAQDFKKKIDAPKWLNWWLNQGLSDEDRYNAVLQQCLKDNKYHMSVICLVGHRIQDLWLTSSSSFLTDHTPFPAFDSQTPPAQSVPDYFYLLVRGSGSDLSTAVLSAFLIYKFTSLYPDYLIHSFRIHKLVLGAVLTSHKYLEEDHPRSNRAFATMCKLDVKVVSQIEAEFMFALGFDIGEECFFGVLGQLFRSDFTSVTNKPKKEKRKSNYSVGMVLEDFFGR